MLADLLSLPRSYERQRICGKITVSNNYAKKANIRGIRRLIGNSLYEGTRECQETRQEAGHGALALAQAGYEGVVIPISHDGMTFAGSLLAAVRCERAGGGRKDNADFSAALFPGTHLIPFAPQTACVIIPQAAQVIKNVRRKASSASSAIDEQFIEVGSQTFRVLPHSRDEIGDARIEIAKCVRLDPTRQSVEPLLGAWQEECNGRRSTLPREVDRNFRPG
jgi:hypothetical protein